MGVWGTFDVENYGDHLFPRIARHELKRRVAGVEVRSFSPFGWLHPTRMDGGEPAESLGTWREPRLVELAAELQSVLIGGGEIIHTQDELLAPAYGATPEELRRLSPSRYFIEGLGPEREGFCPVLWNAVGVPFEPTAAEAARVRTALAARSYVAVRDEMSRERLYRAGVDVEITVVPDSALLAHRVLPEPLLHKRLHYLRAMGWYPGEGPAMVVQGNRDLLPHVPEIVSVCSRLQAAHPDLRVVLAQTGVCHGDDEFAAALHTELAALPIRAFRLPPETGVEDLAAAISAARVFAGSSLHGSITALAFGKPFVALNLAGQSKLDGFARLVGADQFAVHTPDEIQAACTSAMRFTPDPNVLIRLQRRVDDHFDRVAEIVNGSATRKRTSDGREANGQSPQYRVGRLEADLRAAHSAHEALALRTKAERLRLADYVQALRDDHAAIVTRLEAADANSLREPRDEYAAVMQLEAANAAIEAHRRRAAELEAELASMRATKTFRYLERPRRVYGRILKRLQ